MARKLLSKIVNPTTDGDLTLHGESRHMRISRRKNSQTNQVSASEGESNSLTPKTARMVSNRETASTASEEDVFAQLVNDEVTRTQSTTVQASFQELVQKQLKIRTRADGSVNMEKVMKGALKWASSQKQNLISSDDADKIYSRTFSAAQLDSNTEALDDSSVSGATMNRDAAFDKARVKLEKLISGESELPIRDLHELVTASVSSAITPKKVVNNTIEDILLSNKTYEI